MTTNAGPEFFAAQSRYQDAKSPEEKLKWLQEMYKQAPKHKSSENLVAEITYKIAKLRREIEKHKEQQAKRGSGVSLNVKKEGDGQIAILGAPNSGKSFLLKRLTGVDVEVAPYPFTTTKPEVGTMDYKGAKVQLVEVPAIIEGSSIGKANGTQLLSVARNADAIIVVYRDEAEKGMVVRELENAGIIVTHKKPRIFVGSSEFKGVTVSGKRFLKMTEKELESALKSYGIHSASVLLAEDTTLDKLAEALNNALDYKNCLFVRTMDDEGEEELREKVFSLLGKVVIYTKKPGREPDFSDPLVLKKGSIVGEVANVVHKDIAKNLKYARVWGSTKYAGQRVSKSYQLQSGDVIEFSA